MTTPRDLLITALDVPAGRPLAQGELSLTLAGAELIDLIGRELAHLEDDRIVPRLQPTTGDRLLDEAAAALSRETPYESVEDWLWRRGKGLAAAYAADLKARNPTGHHPTGHRRLRHKHTPPDDPARTHAAARWASHDPVLASLAAALDIPEGATDEQDPTELPDDTVTIVAAIRNALTELAAVRQRRRIEDDAFANIWRGA
ncbi:GPP34 family phosphoprotein [Streptomyces sp. Ru71]|uniref:GPP34 family phosphoprotein n=1 Tax=Streptomyces sp. Ru71 TaxID=2080746 RepID=UPI000CDD434D|nr:GPP34 family phosphoprotein [Streptomyces sp. Ru71]POX52392.1 GPP34 family phosphoprotein [Streptomyces sp. Ru71]